MLSVRAQAWVSLAAGALRVVLFAVVLAGGLMADQYRMTQPGSLTRLYEDLRYQRVDLIEYRYSVEKKNYDLAIRWSTGPLLWWEYYEKGSTEPVPREIQEALGEEAARPRGKDFERDLRREMGGQEIEVRSFWPARRDQPFWVQGLPRSWPAVPVAVAALVLFGTMLMTRDHRYANRWAWSWMFLFSPLGMLAYLWLEKRPFPPALPPYSGKPLGGVVGFFSGIALSILFMAGATLLATWLIE